MRWNFQSWKALKVCNQFLQQPNALTQSQGSIKFIDEMQHLRE
jgi:hypothetical protein